jgi:Spy/CpxP family protein refolding chaperone
MDTKKKVLIVGAAALMVMALVVAASAAVQGVADASGKGWMRGGWGKHMRQGNQTEWAALGLPENATREQVSDAMWEKQLKDLGLTDSSTLAEYRQALKAKMQSGQEQRMAALKTKLNLPADATKDDVMNAMKQWRADNKELLGGGMGGRGFGRGAGHGSGMFGGMGFGKGG